jgi:translation initiation factor IF-3
LIKLKRKTIYKKRYNRIKRQPRTRINQWIRISPIRLIDEKGQNVGIIETPKALEMAREKGLDLIEIAPNTQPPVCRIMDYGKYQYQKSKQEKEQRSKQKKIEVKGIRISLRTGQHDLETKAKQSEKFLNKGYKIRIEMILKGREKSLLDLAKEKLNQFIELIPLETKIEQEIKKQPRGLSVVIEKI